MASAELRDTRRRIRSVQATQKITRAMELIAASRIPKAIGRVVASKPYTAKLIEVIQNVGGVSGSASHMLLASRDVRHVGIVVVSSDRGLAGAYASTIIRLAEQRIIDLRREGKEVRIFAIGKKAQTYFRYRGYRISRAFLGVTDTPGYGDARAVANVVMEAYVSEEVDRSRPSSRDSSRLSPKCRLVTTCCRSNRPGEQPVLPWATPMSLPRRRSSTGCCRDMSRRSIFNMLLEASASEHSARRRAMKAATDNADDLIRVLTVAANRARQAEITTEISEIVGGAEALTKG